MDLTKIEDVRSAITGTYPNKVECVSMAEKLRMHYDGRMPGKLITDRRPSEPEDIQQYRKTIYVSKTENPINKVIHSLEKIRRAQDWNIQYVAGSEQSTIAEDETLQRYCEEDYPIHTSITNWAFTELLGQYLIDANGIVAVVLEKLPEVEGEYCKPVAKFFESDQIVEYVEGEYVVLKSRDKCTYYTHNGTRRNMEGSIYYIITTDQFVKYEQTGTKQFTPTDVFPHNIGELPAWKAGGLFKRRVNNDTIYKSRIAGMVPSLDEAAREYSDLQAEIVQHIHSEKYAYTNTECPDCKGTGIVNKDGKQVRCSRCGGTGSILHTTPYGMHLIQAQVIGEQSLPTPPVGYVQKDTKIAELQDTRVRQHIYDALAAVNMEFLAETPIAQSGVAKAYDKEELNNFVNSVAEDIVRNLDNVYYFINEYRYMMVVPSEDLRRAMLPHINVPTKFDIANTTVIMQELKAAREANVSPIILRELETDYAKKQFNTSPEVSQMVEAIFNLDPLFGIQEENKMVMLQNGGILELDYIVSCNIHKFVRRAIHEHEDFYSMEYKKQQEILNGYAEEIKKENDSKAAAMLDFGGLNIEDGATVEDEDEDGANGTKNGNGGNGNEDE